MNIHTLLQMARECVARMVLSVQRALFVLELSVANKDLIVAPGAHLEAIVTDCMLYTPLAFPMSTPHFTASSLFSLQCSSKEKEQVEHKEQDSTVHTSHIEMVSTSTLQETCTVAVH